MLNLFEWSQDYETGNLMVDREHKELLGILSRIVALDQGVDLEDILEEGFKDKEAAIRFELGNLHKYVNMHFDDEKRLLETSGSPDLENQRAIHSKLRSELGTLLSREEEEALSGEAISKLAVWAKDSLLNHFLTTDLKSFHSAPLNDD